MAGEVVAVGVGVNKFRAGDKVLAMINPLVSSNHLHYITILVKRHGCVSMK